MRKFILAAALVSASGVFASAQTTTPPATDGETPAIATPDTANQTAPVEGANSFTEGQASERIAAAGFAEITDLVLDDKGVWQAKATKDGKPVAVSLDYQGNVVAK